MNPERILVSAELWVWVVPRCARPLTMPARVKSSTGQSARTKRSNTRWRRAFRRVAVRQRLACGAAANTAKYLAAEAGFRACETAIMTHGGFGFAKEYHVERYLREILITRIAPISPQLILCYIAERVLGLPKSY
jgi:acyl-CoA dehydrogenase